MRFNAFRTVVLATFMVTAGCGKNIGLADLQGVFVSNFSNMDDRIDLHRDGTYVHFFKVEAGSEDIRNSGSWKLDPKSSVPRIVFRGFILPPRISAAWRNDTNLTIDKPMDWSTTIESSRSEIRIIVNDDLNQYYSKAR